MKRRPTGEDGSVLILAVVFLLVVGLIGGALVTFAGTSLATTSQLQDDRARSAAAGSAVEAAIQKVRTLNTSANAPGYNQNSCPTTTVTELGMQVLCAVGTTPLPYQRKIVFAACPVGAAATSCLTGAATYTPSAGSAALVVATTLFWDLKPGCTGATPGSCFAPGTALDVTSWIYTQASG